MKKTLNLLLAAALAAACTLPAYADDFAGNEGSVEFNGSAMVSDFKNDQFEAVLTHLQPGDSATFGVSLRNTSGVTTDWYMTNEVLQSLEETETTIARGGAYTYLLTYTDQKGITYTLYDSDTVGGEGSGEAQPGQDGTSVTGKIGLNEATDSLEDYFFLDQLAPGEGGHVDLLVGLDGESQGNLYQDTLAQLQMNFAVELSTEPLERPTPIPSTTPGPTEKPAPGSTPGPTAPPRGPSPTPRVRYVYTTQSPQTGHDVGQLLFSALLCGAAGLVLLGLGLRKRHDGQNGQ